MVTTLDLQARHRRNNLPRNGRSRISIGLFSHIPLTGQHYRYSQYRYGSERQIAREIRKNEKRIWKLEKKLYKLERRGGSYRKIRAMEREINWLQRRNDYLRNRLY